MSHLPRKGEREYRRTKGSAQQRGWIKKHTISYILYSMELSLHVVHRRPHHKPLQGVSRRQTAKQPLCNTWAHPVKSIFRWRISLKTDTLHAKQTNKLLNTCKLHEWLQYRRQQPHKSNDSQLPEGFAYSIRMDLLQMQVCWQGVCLGSCVFVGLIGRTN